MRANVAFSGTGGGFEKSCRGEIEISDASRPIKQSEVADCAARGIDDIVEIQVAIDALTVMVNRDNPFVTRPSVLGFLTFYLDNLHALVREVGYIPLPLALYVERFGKLEPYLQRPPLG